MPMNQLHLKQEAVRCLLCENAPCTAASRQGDPARAVRAVRFDNLRCSRSIPAVYALELPQMSVSRSNRRVYARE